MRGSGRVETRDLTPDERRASRFLLAVLAVLAFASLLVIWPFLTGTIFALVVGYLLQRPYRALTRLVRARWLAALLLVLAVIVAVVVPLVLIAWELVQEGRALLEGGGAGAYTDAIVAALARFGVEEAQAREMLRDALAAMGNVAKAGAVGTLGALAGALANVGIFVFLLYYVLVGGDRLAAFVRRAMPLGEGRGEHLLDKVGERVRALFLGTFLVSVIQGVAAGLGWWFFDFPSPVFWGFVMTILAVVPAVGPVLVMLPAGLIALAQGNLFAGIGIIAWGLVVVGLIDNLTRPYIVGRSTDVHPGIVLLGTLGGLSVFGATGFIIGPLLLSMVAPLLHEWESIRPGPG